MDRERYSSYFETLEISPDSSFKDIEQAYQSLHNRCVAMSVDSGSPEETVNEKLRQIENAYQQLKAGFEFEKKGDGRKAALENIKFFNGNALKEIREQLGISLESIALETKIQKKTLEHIEKESYSELPPEVYVKGFVKNYAKCLSLDPLKVIEDYMKGYNKNKGVKKSSEGYSLGFPFFWKKK